MTEAGEQGTRNRTIVVLLGGPSAEHDVSVVSGWAIADALVSAGYRVERLFIDLEGRWWGVPESASLGRPRPGTFDRPREVGAEGPWTAGEAVDRLAARADQPLVFIALHGPFGEDGTVQALLESAGLPYTGAGVAASAVAMDKVLYKRLIRGLGLPVVDWCEAGAAEWEADREGILARLEAFAAETANPKLIVKPARLGSSVGISIAHTASERASALDEAFRYDTLVLVERYLDHPRELEVAVVGNEPAEIEAFGPGEVFPGREFYDYVAKYSDGVSETTPNGKLPAAEAERIRGLAIEAYRAIGCEGLARVDFLMSRGGDGSGADADVYLSEINTIPGFTPISLFPQMAATRYGSFAAVCVRIVELAEERHARRIRRTLTTADLPR